MTQHESSFFILGEVVNENSQTTVSSIFGMNGEDADAAPASISIENLTSLLESNFARKYSYNLGFGKTVKITFGNYY